MCVSGRAYVGIRGENCTLMHNYYCRYKNPPHNMSQLTPQHLSQPTSLMRAICNAIIFFPLDRKSVANYIILRHTYCITLVQALTVMRLVTSFPAQIETRRQESTFVVKKLFLSILHSQDVRQYAFIANTPLQSRVRLATL